MSDEIIVSGFTDDALNGTYSFWKTVDSYPAYQKDSTHIIMYRPKYFGYSDTGAYYLLENKQISGAIPAWVPIARILGTAIEGTWETLRDVTSGEQTVGSFSDESSSSSSVDSSSSSS